MNNKQIRKKVDGKCYFCEESDYNLLDQHRIIPGEDGGKYCTENTVSCCANCHRKIHSGRIVIHGRYYSSAARWVLHFTEDDEEKWV